MNPMHDYQAWGYRRLQEGYVALVRVGVNGEIFLKAVNFTMLLLPFIFMPKDPIDSS